MWYNIFMIWILRSPLHGMLSKNIMLLTCTGRKSGRTYATPVNYLSMTDERGEYLATTSYRRRTWWHNLRRGAPITLQLQRRSLPAAGEVIEDDQGVAQCLLDYFRQAPHMAKYFQVRLGADGQPFLEDIQHITLERILIKIRLVSSN